MLSKEDLQRRLDETAEELIKVSECNVKLTHKIWKLEEENSRLRSGIIEYEAERNDR